MVIAGVGLKTGCLVAGFNPNHLTLEYFHAGRAQKHDDSPPSASENKVSCRAPLQSMRSITFIIGTPGCFSEFFGWFIDPKNRGSPAGGAPYFLAGGLLFTAMLMATRIEQPQLPESSNCSRFPTLSPPEKVRRPQRFAPILDSKENVLRFSPA